MMVKEKNINRIIVKDLKKKFKIGFKKRQGVLQRFISFFSGKEPKKIIIALDNVSFELKKGEILGIVGENGSGKSTLLRIIAGIYKKNLGRMGICGKIISLINLNVGLKERLIMKDNIFLVGALFGLSNKEIKWKFKSIVEFAGLENFINTKIYQFSEGMKQRLVFSIAVHSNPDILLLDEVFAVGDENFRNKSAEKINELVEGGASVILVSHELWMIEKYCDRVIWMEKGKIKREGNVKEILKEYKKQ